MDENCMSNMIPTIISMVISIISLLLSFFVLFKDWWHERLRIRIYFVKWFASMEKNQPFFLWLAIENNSILPYSITKMELKGAKNGINLSAISQGTSHLVATIRKNEEKRDVVSREYPVVVNGYEGTSGYFHFKPNYHAYNFEDQTFTLIIFTNRGTRKFENIKLNFGDNIMRAMEHKIGAIPFTNDAEGNPIQYTSEEL